MKFTSEVLLGGKTATGIEVPASVIEALGAGRKPAVTATVNGYSYRTTVGTRGGVFLIPVSADVRKAAGVEAGQQVEVDLELDTAPREIALPDDLAAALADAPAEARTYYDGLSYSNKQAVVLPIEQAKAPETRARRVAKAVELLTARKVR